MDVTLKQMLVLTPSVTQALANLKELAKMKAHLFVTKKALVLLAQVIKFTLVTASVQNVQKMILQNVRKDKLVMKAMNVKMLLNVKKAIIT